MKKTRNKFETKVLKQLKKNKVTFTYESEKIAYVLARHYIPDFCLKTRLGIIYLECKGYFRPDHKAKMAAVKRQHPEKDIRILFYAKRLKDIKWCERHGYKYAIGSIPEEWLNE